MNEILTQDQNVIMAMNQLETILERMEELKKMESKFREEIVGAMQKYGVKSADIGKYTLTYVDSIPACDKIEKTIDEDKLAMLHPDIYKECIKVETVHSNGRKASVRLTKKKV